MVVLVARGSSTLLAGTFATAAGALASTAYVVNNSSDSVTPIEVATNTPGKEVEIGGGDA